ncbi:hypothetical protein V6N13_058427 [Hibiscus sabdariffa]|uniref:Uncharacterized protein n=1 Tax=Hibiscus sabdariffa TaxID=183260 RepID=A0ABR2GG59_9ROSI
MAPTSRTTRKATKPRTTHCERKLASPTVQQASVLEDLPSNSSTITSDNLSKLEGVDDISTTTTTTSPCSTPKAPRFRIPEVDTCPPAPKKQRVLSNCSLQRTPIAFFAPPDLELFFFFAHRDISV